MRRYARSCSVVLAGLALAAAAPDTASPWNAQNETAMMRMQQGMMAVPRDAGPDRSFVLGMLPHHVAATDMARTELRYGRDPELRRLAQAIIAAQDREIAEMRNWLARHGDRSTGTVSPTMGPG